MASANEILNSRLFKTVAPEIESIPPERLLFELCQINRGGMGLDCHCLSLSFSWDMTPQGYDFWSALCVESMGV